MSGPKDKPLKVLLISSGLEAGGAEGMLLRMLEHVDRDMFIPEVISLTGIGEIGEKIRELGIQVHDLGISRAGIQMPVLSLFRLRKMIKTIGPDVVQTWQYHADLIGGLAARLAGVKAVSWGVRNGDLPFRQSKASTIIVRKICASLSYIVPQKILFNSRASTTIHANEGYDERKFEVIPNGYELPNKRGRACAKDIVCRELKISSKSLLVGFFARLDPVKNHEGFLHAAKIVSESLPNVHFIMSGGGVDSSNIRLSTIIIKKGLGQRVHLLGHRDDMETIYSAIDLHVSASYAEAFPNVIAEAMSYGVPSVSTDAGDSAYIVGNSGKIVPIGHLESLAKGVHEFLSMVPDRRDKYGAQAHNRIKKHFDISHIAKQYQNYFTMLASMR